MILRSSIYIIFLFLSMIYFDKCTEHKIKISGFNLSSLLSGELSIKPQIQLIEFNFRAQKRNLISAQLYLEASR